MNQYISKKIKFISFFLMILVVLLHSQNVSNRFPSFTDISWYNSFIQYIISGGICQIAVPGFFLISGYLYFLGVELKFKSYQVKTLKRIKTLFIPFIFTTLIIYLLFFAFQQFSITSKFINNKIDLNKSFLAIIISIFTNSPSYQLWFIKNLMVICLLLTPLIYFLIKYFKGYVIVLTLLIWIFFSKQIKTNFCPSITFFMVGAFFSFSKYNINLIITGSKSIIIFSIWLILLLFNYFIFIPTDAIINISILFGITCVWFTYDNLRIDSFSFNNTIISLSFFLYLFHEPLLTLFIKLFFSIFGINNFSSFWAYILAPVVTIPIIMLSGYMIKKYFTNTYSLIIGNR